MIARLFLLLVGHALADYAWQPEWMAKHKSPWVPGQPGLGPWWWSMGAHSLINGGMVYVITSNFSFGIWETVIHGGTDVMKCLIFAMSEAQPDLAYLREPVTWIDQSIHVGCKILWASLS